MTDQQKQRNWFARHKILTGILGIIVLFVIISATSNSSKSNTDKVSNSDTTKTEEANDNAEPAKEKMTITNSVAQDKGYGTFGVTGEITNNDSTKHSATLKATFYDAGGKILGTASGAVNEVAPGETKTFDLITMDAVAGYKDMKVQVDTLL